MITIKSKKKDYSINLPTELSEIDKSLDLMTNHITLSEHYSIVAICKHCDLAQFVLALGGNKKNNTLVSVVPLLAKSHNNDIPVGSKIFINRTELERGEHIYINTVASDSNIASYIDSDEDLRKAILMGAFSKSEVYIIEFKIIPNSSIHAYIAPNTESRVDPFIAKDVDSQAMPIPFTGVDEK